MAQRWRDIPITSTPALATTWPVTPSIADGLRRYAHTMSGYSTDLLRVADDIEGGERGVQAFNEAELLQQAHTLLARVIEAIETSRAPSGLPPTVEEVEEPSEPGPTVWEHLLDE